MRNLAKSVALGAVILTVGAMAANADPVTQANTSAAPAQISALPPSSSTPVIQLPPVTVPGYVPSTHYQVPPGYDADVSMHPYTSGLGPCTEGGFAQPGLPS